jgi:hypothetical protein
MEWAVVVSSKDLISLFNDYSYEESNDDYDEEGNDDYDEESNDDYKDWTKNNEDEGKEGEEEKEQERHPFLFRASALTAKGRLTAATDFPVVHGASTAYQLHNNGIGCFSCLATPSDS